MKKKISIIIPFFNEKNNLPLILAEVRKLVEIEKNYEFELLLMDNNSDDGSSSIAKNELKNFENSKYFKLSRNFGYQANIKAGYDKCTGDAAVQLDADGEDDPAIISKFIRQWEKGFEVVYGIREKRHEFFFLTFLRNFFYSFLRKFSEVDIPNKAGDFRIIDRKVINFLKKLDEKNLYLRGLISFIGFKQKGLNYERKKRFTGNSKISLFGYFDISLSAITSFTKTPLVLIFILGIITFIISIFLLLVYFILFLAGNITEPGFTTIILIQLFFFGLLMFLIGIVSIYVGYILDEVKKRPTYIIDENESQ
ncbi:glycosyltransferase family 2 protein [Candidatus Pelagibacter sp.]|nr:glycosyltransferase family 2 protein [Candidatus Pelagibacter sp.]